MASHLVSSCQFNGNLRLVAKKRNDDFYMKMFPFINTKIASSCRPRLGSPTLLGPSEPSSGTAAVSTSASGPSERCLRSWSKADGDVGSLFVRPLSAVLSSTSTSGLQWRWSASLGDVVTFGRCRRPRLRRHHLRKKKFRLFFLIR